MNVKKRKINFFLISSFVIGVAFLFQISSKSQYDPEEKKIFLRFQKNTGPIIRGFQFISSIDESRQISIKAPKFSIEKKKIGIFKISPVKEALFIDAQIDFFEKTNQPDDKISQLRNDIPFKGALSQKTMLPSELKGTVSATFRPVKINLHLDDLLMTRIKAEEAIIDPHKRRMILSNNIQVISGASKLSTNRLVIYPEMGLFEVSKEYEFKTQGETVSGEKLTTDFFLKRVRRK